jgi:hypothetical protein
VTPANGFTGTVAFSVTGLPSGATGAFTPPSLTTSGSSTLNVSTSAATPPGSYPLTIRGVSGTVTRTVNVTLVVDAVNADFTIAATPATRTIARGAVATYTVTITAGQGFSGTVNLTASDVPARTTAAFSPASIVNSGTSVFSVDTDNNTQKKTHTVTITGTGGGRVHSVTVTVTVQ